MKNIAIKAIAATLLVASVAGATVMNCKTEWLPTVKELTPEFPWDKTRGGDIKKRPKRYLCAEFHTDKGNTFYTAIGKKDNELAIVHYSTGGWMASYFFDAGLDDEMGFFAVDAYGIETYAFVPYSDFVKWKRLARTAIASDDSRTESWRKNSDTPQDVPKVKGASRGLAGDCPDSWRDSYGLCKREWFN